MIDLNPDLNRRSFIAAVLGACAAPAIVRAASLMPIWTPPQEIALPDAEIEVVDKAWLEALDGARMSGGSYGDIKRGLCVPYQRDGVVVMGYRFPARRPS